jgi:hypothetical protein
MSKRDKVKQSMKNNNRSIEERERRSTRFADSQRNSILTTGQQVKAIRRWSTRRSADGENEDGNQGDTPVASASTPRRPSLSLRRRVAPHRLSAPPRCCACTGHLHHCRRRHQTTTSASMPRRLGMQRRRGGHYRVVVPLGTARHAKRL